jgi:hypothetical protein
VYISLRTVMVSLYLPPSVRRSERQQHNGANSLIQRCLTFWLCGPPLNLYWKPRTPKPFLRFEHENSTQKIHKLRNILFNSQTKKYTKIGILILWESWCCISVTSFFKIWFYFWNCYAAPTNQAKGTKLIFYLQFHIPSLLQSVLKISI